MSDNKSKYVGAHLVRSLDDAQRRTRVDPKKAGTIGLNHLGQPEGFFIYGHDRGSQTEHTVDLVFDGPVAQGPLANPSPSSIIVAGSQHQEQHASSATLLCPKCHQPLTTTSSPGREIIVHWNKTMVAEGDGRIRPLVTIEGGPIRCDYGYNATSGKALKGRLSGSTHIMAQRCNWKGLVFQGKCLDC